MTISVSTMTTNRAGTFEDIPAMVDLYNLVLIDQWGKEDWDVESAESEMRDPEFDMGEHTRLWFDHDQNLVGFGMLVAWGKPPVRAQNNAFVRPDYPDRLALALEILTWGEGVAWRVAVPQCPPEAQVSVTSFTFSGYPFSEQMFAAFGMERIRQFLTMQIDLSTDIPEPVLPEGFSIRTVRVPEEARELYHITDEAFSDHYGHVDDPEGKNFDRWEHLKLNDPKFDASLWFVVEAHGEYAGFAWCHLGMPDDHDLGWVDTLGTLPAFRKHGVGLALLHHAFRVFKERGMARAGLGVDASSLTGATRLYERAGMKPIAIWDSYAKVIRPGVDLIRQ